MKPLLIRCGPPICCMITSTNNYSDNREAKRGGTAPGESRKNAQLNYDMPKVYAINTRL